MEDLDQDGKTINNSEPEGYIYRQTVTVVKCPEVIGGLIDEIEYPLCDKLYKEEEYYIVPWFRTEPYAKKNFLTRSRENKDWVDSTKVPV